MKSLAYLFAFILLASVLPLVAAQGFKYDNSGIVLSPPASTSSSSTNYSTVNVNNSQFLRGYTPFNLPYLTSFSEVDPSFTSWLATNPLSPYVLISNLVNYVGNWTADKPNYDNQTVTAIKYYNKSQVDANLSNYYTKSQDDTNLTTYTANNYLNLSGGNANQNINIGASNLTVNRLYFRNSSGGTGTFYLDWNAQTTLEVFGALYINGVSFYVGGVQYARGNITNDKAETVAFSKPIKIYANVTSISCNSTNEGTIYYDGSNKKHWGCNSTTWNALY